jgi:glycosyltransferase involved in cell wall biosynthesis
VRDAEATLAEALESIRAQSFGDFRCLVLDDGSVDGSPRIAAEVAARDSRFEVHRLPRAGLVAALNAGIARAEAPIVVRADADDRNDPQRFAIQMRALDARPDLTVVASRVRFLGAVISPELRSYESWLNEAIEPDAIERDLFVESPIPHPAAAMRTDALRRVGGYRDGTFPEDYDLWLRGWRAGWKFAKAPETLVHVRDHGSRLTRTDARYLPRAFLACKAEHLVAACGLAGREVIVWGAGRDGVRAARELKRRGVGIRMFVDIAASKIGRSVVGAPIRAPQALDAHPGVPIVVAVGVKGARAQIRAHLAARGYREPVDFVCFG